MERDAAERIVDALMYDLSGRRGFDLDDIDRETLMEWRAGWVDLVVAGGNGKQCWWVEAPAAEETP